MTNYTVYQCSICRRIKDIVVDQTHAAPNQCIITKGCSGFLFPIGQTNVLTTPPPVSGLTDWYPRGQKPTTTPAAPTEKTIDLSTSSGGIITLALYLPGSSPPSSVVAAFTQQLDQDIPYNEFIFNIAASTTTISGKDSTGKNLRFSTANVASGLVFVLVNGVARFPGSGVNDFTYATNVITFNTAIPAGAIVTVSVYAVAPTTTILLTFTLNQNHVATATSGAWGNIRWVEEYDPATGTLKPNKWWIYSCNETDVLSKTSRLSFFGTFTTNNINIPVLPTALAPTDFSGIRFLLAAPPYDNTDRYLNFYIDGSLIANEYTLLTSTSTITELFSDTSALVELYPPFQLIEATNGSYVSADTFSTTDSVSSTMPETRLVGTKILGPV
jgi:hypothetical protein